MLKVDFISPFGQARNGNAKLYKVIYMSVKSVFTLIIFMEDTTINKQPEVEINRKIRDRAIRLIGENGEQLGIMSADEANKIADDKNLDLVKISPQATPPVCKLMDYSKFKFEKAKKEKEAKKNQKLNETKKIWLSMTIDRHDLETKARAAEKFVTAGNKVEVSIRMRGRQQAHSRLGVEVMQQFYSLIEEVCVIERSPLTEGRNILMILAPKK